MKSCSLCSSSSNISSYQVTPILESFTDSLVPLCHICILSITDDKEVEHWHCLSNTMWSQNPAVQVLIWRLLQKLSHHTWAQNLFEMMYLDDNVMAWAKANVENQVSTVSHKDCNGISLLANDNVTIIKDLNVKGSSMVAKRGTIVKKISLVLDNAEQIEGRVDGQKIVLLTKFVKKI